MEILPYLAALGQYWWALMGCAVFTILGAYVLAAHKSNRWALSATFGIAIVMLFLASFPAWQDQYRRANSLQRSLDNRPKFDVYADTDAVNLASINSSLDVKGEARLILVLIIRNPGSPTALTSWLLDVEDDRGKKLEIPPSLLPKTITFYTKGRPHIYENTDSLVEKTFAPLSSGAITRGILGYEFHDYTYNECRQFKNPKVIFFDVSGGEHSISFPWPQGPGNNEYFPGVFPGLKSPQ
jgi:hypothetical protein